MPAAKLFPSGSLNAMKSGGNDSLDTFIRQAIGKEPLLPFSRAADSPVQWIQLLHALDQPDLPGWPLLTPAKVQMQKCEKCSQEFCSPINYRRHSRVHRRALNINKGCNKNRDLLAAFWDKLSVEQAKEVVSFDDVMLKEIPGLSITTALASSLRKPGVWTLPQVYVKAGATLLDIIQAKPSRLPVSSQEFFSILDDASERTFLCAGTAESVQKFIFDGETAKNGLDLKNLVATTSFLLEQNLVRAWVADKDAESLRCQKLLVEEEEAAQRRQALLLERKKQKKLRQKEQKVREQLHEQRNVDLNVNVDGVDRPTSNEASGPSTPSDSSSILPDLPTNMDSGLDSLESQGNEADKDIEAQIDFSTEHIEQEDSTQTIKLQPGAVNNQRRLTTNRWQVPKSQRSSQPHVSPNFHTSKPESVRKLGPSKDRNLLNGSKVWTKKLRIDSNGEKLKPPPLRGETIHQIKENNREVIIGSIPVTLNSCVPQVQDSSPDAQDVKRTEHNVPKKKNASEKPIKANATIQAGTNRVTSKLWRPVSRRESKSTSPVDRGNNDSEGAAMLENAHDQIPLGERHENAHDQIPLGERDQIPLGERHGNAHDQILLGERHENAHDQQECLPFSSVAAKEFLAQRWKEAIAADHVQLVLSSPGCSDVIRQEPSKAPKVQVQFSKKPDKSIKLRYIPKHKTVA